MPLRIATRASLLARWQAEWVAARLRDRGLAAELVLVRTEGDRRAGPLAEIGGAGLFTKEVQQAVLRGEADVTVHSLKDLPTEPTPGLRLAAVPPRWPAWDVLVTRDGRPLADLPPGAVVGTGSLRRRAQLLLLHPTLAMADIRGNVDTRLEKLRFGQYDAVVLAAAGIERLELDVRGEPLRPPAFLPAVGQGALGIEARDADGDTLQMIAPLDDSATRIAVIAERAMLAALRGGCLAPVAAWGRVEGGDVVLAGRVLSLDGSRHIDAQESGPTDEAEAVGRRAAERLVSLGAAELIAAARR